jgi:hypothetical protein
MIESIISELVESPSEDNKQKYLEHIAETEYALLVESNELTFKSREYYDKRIEAFSYRRESAMRLISAWVSKYGTSENCVISYADTLNIPFREIKNHDRRPN